MTFKSKILKSFLSKVPMRFQREIVRRSINCRASLESDVTFKLAETQSEFEQAFALVHVAYAKQGFVKHTADGMHMVPQHLLDSTVVLIAKKGDEVIGTMTVVRNESYGLPGEGIAPLESLGLDPIRLAEITCLAVKSQYRRSQGGAIFFHLMKYSYEFSTQFFGVRGLIAVIHPKDVLFYESLLCFKLLTPTPVDYMGAPAVLVYLDLEGAEDIFRKIFAHRRFEQNLHQFFAEEKIENYTFPTRKYCEVNYRNPELPWLGKVAQRLSLPIPRTKMETRSRHAVDAHTEFWFGRAKILDVSMDGFKVVVPDDVNLNTTSSFLVNLKLSQTESCAVVAELKWKNSSGLAGFKIQSSPYRWKEFIDYLNMRSSCPNALWDQAY